MENIAVKTVEKYEDTKSQETRDKGGDWKKYMCLLCGLIYDEAEGWPEEGIAAGTRWEDVSINWRCPDCGASKADFEMVEI